MEKDDETGKNLRMIDAREVVAILSMFDIDSVHTKASPTMAYSSKAKVLSLYLEDPEHYRKFVNVAPDIFDLYDAIETEFAEAYNGTGGRYGRKKYSGYKEGKVVGKSKFGQQDLQYKVPDGLLYPVVAAFRTLIVDNPSTGKYEWYNGEEPIAVWERCKADITSRVMSFAASIGDNPNTVGKDANIWDLAYMTVTLQK